jgi:cytochrome oxidase assembly protein ShyY1
VLVPDEGDGSTTPDASRIVRTLDVAGIASTLPYDLAPHPLQLVEQTPSQTGDLPVPVPLPELSEGPHLSYAIQWFSFAAIALAGAAILVRREKRIPRGGP